MSTSPKSDATFLAEVEEFLVLCDLPTFPSLQASNDVDDCSSTKASLPTEASAQGAVSTKLVDVVASERRSKGKKKKMNDLEAALKYEMLKAKDRKRRSEYRERRRIEKETLQQQVEELTTELAEQQKTKKLVVSSTWQMVAKRQLQACLNSEAEQRRLFECDTRSNGKVKVEPSYQHKRLRVEPSDAEFYEAYLHELDNIYARTDKILTMYGLDSTDTAWGDPKRKWKEDDTNGYYMFLDKQIIPFSFQETSEKLWQVCDLPHRQVYNGVGDPDNTVAFTFRNTTRLNSGRVVSVLQRVASRRYRDTDRMVIVWRSLAEGEGIFTGMHADETGWAVITPLKSETLMRTCMRYVPMHFSGSLKEEYAVKEFTEIVLERGAKEAVEITNAFEKLLLKTIRRQ